MAGALRPILSGISIGSLIAGDRLIAQGAFRIRRGGSGRTEDARQWRLVARLAGVAFALALLVISL
jgi:hypothetical protein